VNNRETISLAPHPAADVLVLPAPPRDNEKYRYVSNHGWVLTVLTVASFPLLLFSQLRMTFHYHWLLLYSPVLLIAALFFAMPLVTEGFGGGFDFAAHRRLVATWHPVTYPSVDVFLPVCGEPVAVLRNTWEKCGPCPLPLPGHRHPLRARLFRESADPSARRGVRILLFHPAEPGLV
jgi:cellulose synthase (UDP-forming)